MREQLTLTTTKTPAGFYRLEPAASPGVVRYAAEKRKCIVAAVDPISTPMAC